MYSTLMISLREGIEAFLIVAMTLAYLRKTGRESLVSAVFFGTGVAIVASFVAAYFFNQASNKPFWEGLLASVAAVMVFTLILYMFRHAHQIRAQIAARIEQAAVKSNAASWWSVFAFVLLMIVREGMETALMISSLALQNPGDEMLQGAVIGVTCAGLLAALWGRYGHRVNVARFLQVTAIFLLLFVVQLFIYAFHEFTEGGVFPGIDNEYWHIATEPYGPEGIYGQWLSYSMVLLPFGWLFWIWVKDRLLGIARNQATY